MLHAIDPSGRVEARFGLGRGFTGGLAYRDRDGGLYAIETNPEGFSSTATDGGMAASGTGRGGGDTETWLGPSTFTRRSGPPS
jgi:hypothetical protein